MHISRFYRCNKKDGVSVRVSIAVIKQCNQKQIGNVRVYSGLQFSGPLYREYKPGTLRQELKQSNEGVLLSGFLFMAC